MLLKQIPWSFFLLMVSVQPVVGMHKTLPVVHAHKKHKTHLRTRPTLFTASPVTSRAELDAVFHVTDSQFAQVPGYDLLKKRIGSSLETKTQKQIQGYLFELDVARYMSVVEKHTIYAFEQKYTHPLLFYTREIDIVTNYCAIECKNIDWESVQRSKYITSLLAQQLSEQAELVRIGAVGVPHFMVCSKNQIPFEWKKWFWNNAILYAEGFN